MSSSIISVKPLGFQWETKDPFLFCAHHRDAYPAGNERMGPAADLGGRRLGSDFSSLNGWSMYHGEKVPGFPVHPHRGFETVTIVLEGFIDHTDSAGATGRYGNGDVQWMTAGTGLLHAEMFPLLNRDKPNTLELFQLWLTLPGIKKRVEPYFRMLWKESIPIITVTDDKGKKTHLTIISGKVEGKEVLCPSKDSWASNPANEVVIVRIKMEPGAEYTLPVAAEETNRMLFFYKGDELLIEDQSIPAYQSIELKANTTTKITSIRGECELLWLQGKPIDEPVVQYGPFVMNTEEEIHQTITEFRTTGFGQWPWPEDDFVHPRDTPRFAKYSDGTTHSPDVK